ncbi:SPOSA6832_04537 [Sporobolomyces salmonicolor]|uniref:PAN2-PAN3 deadenylation complex subunit PAN3 n=1 Tax=Sporidiobolus salmonicolor TaxID=5005 RepID=A0A0D6ERG9_SPOSA|nr:SPOSA6832_04537 [Sporobolomyces salmonicolor]
MPAPGSAAIAIVRPSPSQSATTSPTAQPAKQPNSPAKQETKLCRNILIYGSCRFQDKGCVYSHHLVNSLALLSFSSSLGSSSPPAVAVYPAFEAFVSRSPVRSPPRSSSNQSYQPASLRVDACFAADRAAPSTPLSVASAANAAVFIPGASGTSASGKGNGSGTLTPSGGSAMGPTAAEFVPRRSATPALSEDAPFFTPAGSQPQPSAEPEASNGYAKQMLDTGQGQGGAEGMAEYYQQAMDLNAPDYRQTPSSLDPSAAALNPYNFSHALAPPGANGGAPGIPGLTPNSAAAAAAAAAEAAYYNNGLGMAHHLGGMGHFTRQPLQYHLYHPLPSTRPHHPHSALPRSSGAHSPTTTFFLPPSLHISLTQKSEATQATPSVDLKLPEDVGGGWIYKAWKEGEGRCYVLRRIEVEPRERGKLGDVPRRATLDSPLVRTYCSQASDCSTKSRSRRSRSGREYGIPAWWVSEKPIVFVYDYHPCSQTLYEAHLSPSASLPPNPWSTPSPLTHTPFRGPRSSPHPSTSSPSGASSNAGLPERVLWSYIVQIGSALKCVHQTGLAMRTVEVNRVIVTGKNRVRLGGAGVMDCLTWDGGHNVAAYQVRLSALPPFLDEQDDLLSFGKLIIALSCGSPSAVHNLPKSVDHISRVYSPDLKNVVLYLLSKPGPRKTVDEVLALMGPRVVDELNSSLVAEDTIERELMRELENGRLVRLLCKFGFINERPEFDHDPRWAETGDRYLIKLFRDHVFHQVDEQGRPVTDLGHVLTALNKLDAGTDEKLMLVSRDEGSCLIVSYREIKNCIESAYADLSRSS